MAAAATGAGGSTQPPIAPCQVKVDLATGWWDQDALNATHSVLVLAVPVRSIGKAKELLGDDMLRNKFVPCVIPWPVQGDISIPTKAGYVPDPAPPAPTPPTGPIDKTLKGLVCRQSVGTATDLSGLPPSVAAGLGDLGVTTARVGRFVTTWRHTKHSDALAAVMPPAFEAVHSFERIAHVAHVNMQAKHLPYKQVIAQVLMDYHPSIRTLVNKTGSIDTVFRTFALEVLRGDPDLTVSLRENGINFTFQFDKVYWNSRLASEHARMVNWVGGWDAAGMAAAKSGWSKTQRRAEVAAIRAQHTESLGAAGVPTPAQAQALKAALAAAGRGRLSAPQTALRAVAGEALTPLPDHPPAVVADMFCGIGPFALPLANRGTVVHANDLNPESVSSLQMAAEDNGVPPHLVLPSNADGRAFIRGLLEHGTRFDHVFMNLPADALSFCDVFVGAFPPAQWGPAHSDALCRVNRPGGTFAAALPPLTPAQSAAAAEAPCEEALAGAPMGGAWPLPRVHCYCFSKRDSEAEACTDVAQRLGVILGRRLGEAEGLRIRTVRDVAPSKLMMLASFTLPVDIALARGESALPDAKRARVE